MSNRLSVTKNQFLFSHNFANGSVACRINGENDHFFNAMLKYNSVYITPNKLKVDCSHREIKHLTDEGILVA